MRYDVIIVGGGPAGLTAGIYAARAGLKALLLEENMAGGQVVTTDAVMNYPGFPEGIGGPELMMLFEQQAAAAGLEIRYEAATGLELAGEPKRVEAGGEALEACSVILCMGARRRTLGVPGEQALFGSGVSVCATCDGALYRGKEVAVVGGGDTAVEEALYLARICAKVTLIHRRGELRARGREVGRLAKHANIRLLLGAKVESFKAEGKEIVMALDAGGEARELTVAGCFIAIGMEPNTGLVKGQVDLDEAGYVLAGEDTRTNLPRVFAAGDLRTKALYQIATAVADGAVAASQAGRCAEG